MTIKIALDLAKKALTNVERPLLEAEILLAYHLQESRIFLHLNQDTQLENSNGFFQLIKQRQQHYPLEYLTKQVSFYSKTFNIIEGVLIPRPETELLVDKAMQIIANQNTKNIAEIGTGSGVISIILASNYPNLNFIATDINKKAICLARQNANNFKIHNIDFEYRNYLTNIQTPIDLLISNPPYIANDYKLAENVHFEPKDALFAGNKGDEILKQIINLSIKRNIPVVVLEIGFDQRSSLSIYLKQVGIKKFQFYKDLNQCDRVLIYYNDTN